MSVRLPLLSHQATSLKEQITTGKNTAHQLSNILERAEVVWVNNPYVILDNRELVTLDALIESIKRVDELHSDHPISLIEQLYGNACRAQLRCLVMTCPPSRDSLSDCIMGELLHLFSCCVFPDLGRDLLKTVKLKPESFSYLQKDPISFLTFKDQAGHPYSVCVQELLRRANECVQAEEPNEALRAAIEACSRAEIKARETFSSIA